MARKSPTSITQELIQVSRRLSQAVSKLQFGGDVTHVYNPLEYAREPHERYIERYGDSKKRLLFVGMNPGPFGMAQTGVPFGDVKMVRDFLGIEGAVNKPAIEHPKRPVEGFACRRSEVSGTRVWGFVKERYCSPDAFFKVAFVWNYCPLCFMEASGKNRTPDQLSKDERFALYSVCDTALRATAELLEFEWIIGIGNFAERRAVTACAGLSGLRIGSVLHPSPANPRANLGWTREVTKDLRNLGLTLG
ncbi:MAG TPA: uracil-DNA glycosylase family protein [Polyangiaceae bacterium]